ncbi:hypothetical protein ACFPPD_26835 [Cohnella suwonensis]|uniref:DUF192 domain-containing protein n=1 Tax=Cohnella suwonensis TaxID=696072 RepID=A0ABW0M2F2_9BACL
MRLMTTVLLFLNLSFQEPMLFQVFDIRQGKVIEQRPLTRELEESILSLLNSSPSTYGGFTMNPADGLILHVIFEDPIRMTSDFYPEPIKEIYLFLEPDIQPKALIFLQDKSRYRVVVLHGNSDQFILRNNLITE